MENTFNPMDYLNGLGKELVTAFELAGKASHPGAVGSGRERSAKEKLKRVLPNGVGVGSGFVIDSYGNTSKQCDIILYEEQFALKFALNDDELYTYYNCENVIAVGQVKSDASINDVRESIKNLYSVRTLKRLLKDTLPISSDDFYSYRPYLSKTSFADLPEDRYNPDIKYTDQILTFLICKTFNTPAKSILAEINKICDMDRKMYPNRLLSIDGDYCFWLNCTSKASEVKYSAIDSTHFTKQKFECVFGQFVKELTTFINVGRSVPINNTVYLLDKPKIELKEPIYRI